VSIPIPRPSILDMCQSIAGRRRWRSADGSRLFEWDALHGEVEVYNARGMHLGAMDPITGDLIKPPVKGRRIDV